MDKGLARLHAWGVALKNASVLQLAEPLIERLDDLFFAREVVVDDAGAGAGPFCDEGHGRVMEATLDDHVQHGVEDGVAFARLNALRGSGRCWHECHCSTRERADGLKSGETEGECLSRE